MRLAIVSLFLLAAAGCTPSYDISVTSWSDGADVSNRSYCIVAAATNAVPNDLQFSEFASYVKQGLAARGYAETTVDRAELLIVMAYGIDGSYTTSYTYIDDDPLIFAGRFRSHPVFVGGGYSSSTYVETNYIRFLHLAAYDKTAAGARGPQRWRIDIANTESSRDLRQVMPYMVAAAYGYIGQDTGKEVDIRISRKDARYRLVTGTQP